MPSLTIKEGPNAGRRFDFRADLEIGRDARAGIFIDDRTISRRHAALSVRPDGVHISDLKSQNGTAVNRRRVRSITRLTSGDEVRVGGIVLRFEDVAEPEHETTSVRLIDSAPAVIATLGAANPVAALAKDEGLSAAVLRKRIEVLHDVSVAFHLTLDESALLSRILEKLLEVLPSADRGFIMLLEEDGETLRPGAVRVKPGISGDLSVSRTLVWDVIKNRRGIVSADARLDSRLQAIHSITSLDLRAVCCVPMIADDMVQGVIALDSMSFSGTFGKDELSLLVAIAAQAALALAKARLHKKLLNHELMQRDLELAERIQARFLPREGPRRPGWTFQAHYQPALEIGGDYYDFLELPERHVGIGIGDVSGKGISAALCMVKLSTELRYQAAGRVDPAEVLREVNRVLTRELEEGMFVTCLVLVLEPDTGELAVASAGHMAPLVRRTDGSVWELAVSRTPPLGVHEAAVFTTRRYHLEEGEVAVVYTDGISEATKVGGDLYGTDRLLGAIGHAEADPESVMNAILDEVKEFTVGEPQSDDITLVCIGRMTGEGSFPAETWDAGRDD